MLKVLIVEDEEIIRDGLKFSFDWLKHDLTVVASCESGEEGLVAIADHAPDIVISDIKMANMTGLEMIERAKDEGYTFESILLTSYSDFDYAKSAIDLKVSEYLLKPISDKKLLEVILKTKAKIIKDKGYSRIKDLLSVNNINGDFFLRQNASNPHVAYALEKIKTSYTEKLSLEMLTEETGVSISYLSRVFKLQTSMTFTEYLNKYRVQQAIQLLIEGKDRFYEIAEKVGFSDYKRFHQVFKEEVGSPPTEFVKKLNKNN